MAIFQVWPGAQVATSGVWHRTTLCRTQLVGTCLSLPEVADRLGIPRGRIKQLLRDRKLVAVRRPDGTLGVPAAFLDGDQIIKGLHGTLTLLFDCGFDEPEAVRWLFTADDTLPGTPDPGHRRAPGHRGEQAGAGAGVLTPGRSRVTGGPGGPLWHPGLCDARSVPG